MRRPTVLFRTGAYAAKRDEWRVHTQNEARTVMRERREERKGTCMHGAIEVRAINRSKHNDIRHTHIQAPPCCPLTLLLPVPLATNTRIQPQHPATGECQKRQRLIGLDSAQKRDRENPKGYMVLFRLGHIRRVDREKHACTFKTYGGL